MKTVTILLSTILIISAASIGLGIININDLIEDPITELSEIGNNIQNLLPNQQPDSTNTTPTNPTDTDPTDPGNTDTTKPANKPWQEIDCSLDTFPPPPGYTQTKLGWTPMQYETSSEYTYEGFQLVHNAGKTFALGDRGTLLRLDDGFWTTIESNTTTALNGMMIGTWPSYIVGEYGVIRSYNPVTGPTKNFETPFDNTDFNDRPHLYTAFGSNHEDFYVLGDGVFYHYHHLPPSHPQYNASDPTPKWESKPIPVTPASIRGPYEPYISDVWVYDYDSVFILVTNPSTGTQKIHEWDGEEWTGSDDLPTSSLVRGIWGLAPDDIFAVGVGATLLHYDGVDWSEYNNIGLDMWNSYTDVWGTSHNNLYIVGDASTTSRQLLHYDGEYWTGMTVPLNDGIGSIVGWGEGVHTVYFSGYDGGIYQYLNAEVGQGEDIEWLQITSDYSPVFNDYVSDGNTVYIGGMYWTSGINGVNAVFAATPSGEVNVIPVSPDVSNPRLEAVAVNDEKLYAAGYAEWGTPVDYFVCTMSKNGGEVTYFYESLEDAGVMVRKMAVDDEGNVIVAGLIEGSFGEQTSSGFSEEIPDGLTYTPHAFDAFVAKYSSDGVLLWSQVFGAPERVSFGLNGESIDQIVVDENGDILVAGFSYSSSGFMVGGEAGVGVSPIDIGGDGSNENIVFLIKFSADGTPIAAKAWETESYQVDLEETSNGYYLIGSSSYAEFENELIDIGRSNLFVFRLMEDLDVLWSRFIGDYNNQWFKDATVGPDDSVFLTGLTTGEFGGHSYVDMGDVFVTRLSDEGVVQGSRLLGGTGRDESSFVMLNQFGKPVVLVGSGSTDVTGYEAGLSWFVWDDIDLAVDQYAECRLYPR